MPQTAKEKREARDQRMRDEGARLATEKLNAAAMQRPGDVADAHGPIARPSSAGAKVIVGCKLGVAFLDIQLCKIEEKFEQNMQGGRTVKEATRIGSLVRLRGTAYPRGTPPKGFHSPPEIVNGAALTRGVDKDWFDTWMEQNKLNPIVLNKMVFAHDTDDGIRGESKDLEKFLSGLEPVNPTGDARIPKSSRSEVSDIESGVR